MDGKVCIPLVIVALAVLASQGSKAAALAAGTASIDIDAGAEVRQLMSASLPSSMKLEDGVAPELAVALLMNREVHRRVLDSINPNVLDGTGPSCKPHCSMPGAPYTGRPCAKVYGCRQGQI
ncbi:hypothetical protein ZWY2020_026679 [Hordeum vulgare]|nr:hypothetical protein ZWY2020_026679 [Hordeum vulgare]